MRRRLLEECGCTSQFINCVAGDICLVDNNTLDKLIIEADNYNLETFPLEQYTPIGVVVVPASHTDDCTARIISLASMDYDNPDNGNTDRHVDICWGGNGYDVPNLPYKTFYPCISTDIRNITAETQTIVEWNEANYDSCFLSSDQFNSYPNPYDEGTYYYTGTTTSSTYHAGPSPYLTGGAKNEIYHDTSNTGNALADMDGKSNTEKILSVDNSTDTSWQTAATINNVGSKETTHTAAQCCWRYHTVGTQQGDWYLPSAGELGYLAARWKAINASISKIISFGVVPALELPFNHWWSSTEYSSTLVVMLYFFSESSSLFSGYTKVNRDYTRAFLAV